MTAARVKSERLIVLFADLVELVFRFLVLLVACSAVAAIILAGTRELADYRLSQTDPSEIFEYFEVAPAGIEDGQLLFTSDRAIYRTVDEFRWIDQLLCPPGNGVRGTYESSGGQFQPAERVVTDPWTWDGPLPPRPVTCNLRSTTIAVVNGHEFHQTVFTEPFVTPDPEHWAD